MLRFQSLRQQNATSQETAAESDIPSDQEDLQIAIPKKKEKGTDKAASLDHNNVIRVENSEEEEGPSDPDPIPGSSPICSPKCPPDKKSSSSKRKKK
ncbi:hypothetical protein U1Q18_042963, partial [Sarracenia purpurea var. burkii]